jgi:hypothetical protein
MTNRPTLSICVFALMVGAVTTASAYDRRVVIVNKTSANINEFYASSTGARSWQEDILGNEVLQSGDSVRINIDDGTGYCKYDFRAVFEDGTESVKRGVNVCEVGKFTFRD